MQRTKTLSAVRLTNRELSELREAIGSKSAPVLREAIKRDRVIDSRLRNDYLAVLDGELDCEFCQLIAEDILPFYGAKIFADLERGYDRQGYDLDARKLRLMAQVSPRKAKKVLLETIEAGSFDTREAAVECLGSYAGMTEYLLGLPGDTFSDSSIARALALQDTPDARKWLLAKLEAGELHLLYRLENRAIKSAATKKAKRLLLEIQSEGSEAKRDELGQLMVRLAALGSSKSKPHQEFLLDCLKSHKLFGAPKGLHDSDVLQDLLVEIGLGPKSLAMELIPYRNKLPARCFGVVADAGRKWMTPDQFFKTFSKYLAPKATAKSAAEVRNDLLEEVLSRELSHLSKFGSFSNGREKRKLDPRWLKVAFRNETEWLILELANLGHPKLHSFLTSQWKNSASRDIFYRFPVIEAMVRSKHAMAAEVFCGSMKKKALGKRFDPDYQRWLYLLKWLPRSCTREVEELVRHPKCNSEAKTQIPFWLGTRFDEFSTVGAVPG